MLLLSAKDSINKATYLDQKNYVNAIIIFFFFIFLTSVPSMILHSWVMLYSGKVFQWIKLAKPDINRDSSITRPRSKSNNIIFSDRPIVL